MPRPVNADAMPRRIAPKSWRTAKSNCRRRLVRAIWCATRIAPFSDCSNGASPPTASARGQWYFLRVLWITDGLSQRELSARVGMMEPTTVIALRSMERAGLIRRVRGDDDRRKMRVYLSAKAKRLRNELLTVARGITDDRRRGNRAARSRLVPPGHCTDDGESRPDRALEHDPGKWEPVFGEDHAPMK